MQLLMYQYCSLSVVYLSTGLKNPRQNYSQVNMEGEYKSYITIATWIETIYSGFVTA